jgi:hypothetical protein
VHPPGRSGIARQYNDARRRKPRAETGQQAGEHGLVAEIAEAVVSAD